MNSTLCCHQCNHEHNIKEDEDFDGNCLMQCPSCGSKRGRPITDCDVKEKKKKQCMISPIYVDVLDDGNTAKVSPANDISTTASSSSLTTKEDTTKNTSEEAAEIPMTTTAGWTKHFWDEDSPMDIESWLKSTRPSYFSTNDFPWIFIDNVDPKSPGYRQKNSTSSSFFHEQSYQPALEEISQVIESGKRVSAAMKTKCIQSIQTIAQKEGCTVGKWILFFKPQDADEQWEIIARATAQGKLGFRSKVNPTKNDRSIEQDAVCCIYTANFGDQQDVQRVLRTLQSMGFVVKSGYKPDVFTHLGIYQTNKWRLPPTLYSVKEALNWQCDDPNNKSAEQVEGTKQQVSTFTNVQETKFKKWDGTSKVKLDTWLEANRPSQHSESEYDWIQVENGVSDSPGYDSSTGKHHVDTSFDVASYQPALDKISATIQSGKRVNVALKTECITSLQQIARQNKLTCGKWMLWLESDEVDEKWNEIARATAEGRLGSSAKIKPSAAAYTNESIVCHVYTKDFDDKDDIRRVLLGLEDLGFHLRSGYKPEFFSLLGIQSKNEWRLPSTLYSVKDVLGWGTRKEDDAD